MRIMLVTTAIETAFFACQCYVLLVPSSDDYCTYVEHLPEVSFIPTCDGVLKLFMGLNLLTVLIYWYFCAIAYEYYFMACNDLYLREYERKTVAREKKKQIQKI